MKIEITHEKIYYLFFSLWIVNEVLVNSTYESILGIDIKNLNSANSVVVFIGMLILILIKREYSFNELCMIVLFSVIILIATYNTGILYLASTWMFVVAAKGIDLDYLIKLSLVLSLIMTAFVLVSCFAGIIDDVVIYRNFVIPRHSLGFAHPNRLGQRIFQISTCFLYTRRENVRKRDILLLLALLLFAFSIPNSQTCIVGMVIILLLLFVFWVIPYRVLSNYSNYLIEKTVIIGSLVISNTISLFLIISDFTKTRIGEIIDIFLSYRFSKCHRVYDIYGISLFGQKIYVTESEQSLIGMYKNLTLDNGYAWILLRFGVILYLIVSVGYIYMTWDAINRNNIILAIILVAYGVYGIMEMGAFLISYNLFLIAYVYIVYKDSFIEEFNSI